MKKLLKPALAGALSCLFIINSSPVIADKPGFNAPMAVEGTQTISTKEAKTLFDKKILFIDVRRPGHRNGGEHIPNAVNISTKYKLSEAELLKVMKKDQEAVFYCHGNKCPASSKGLKKAVGWGFTNLYYYREGIDGWKAAGYKINKNSNG